MHRWQPGWQIRRVDYRSHTTREGGWAGEGYVDWLMRVDLAIALNTRVSTVNVDATVKNAPLLCLPFPDTRTLAVQTTTMKQGSAVLVSRQQL